MESKQTKKKTRKAAAKTQAATKQAQKQEPKRLSKWGEWIKNPDREVWIIKDMKAVLR